MKNKELERAKLLRALLNLHITTMEVKELSSRLNGNDQLEIDLERLQTVAGRICVSFAQGRYQEPEPPK